MIPDAWREVALEPPTAWGAGPLAAGRIRAAPEDFRVEEILGFSASGNGPHALLQVRKRGANTEWVARELARVAGCKPFEVGFAGLKDRHAVTTQFFTVPRGRRQAQDFAGLAGEGFEVLAAAEHQRKLPRGALEGNRFAIVVRDFDCDPAALIERLECLRAGGVPNYFGQQRFGRDAGNLDAVAREAARLTERAELRGADSREGGRRGRGNDQGGFTLSAARSLVFNAILADRVRRGDWNRLHAGDVANLDGRGSVFAVDEVDEALAARCAALEVHPTAPLVGEGEPMTRAAVREREEVIAGAFPEALTVIKAARMNAERRALRLRVRELEHDHSPGLLTLRFSLSAGSFATTVLREIIGGLPGE